MSRPRLHGLRDEIRGDVLAQDRIGIDVLVESRQHESRRKLAADLVLQRVPELQRGVPFRQPGSLLIGEALQIGVRDAVGDTELAPLQGDESRIGIAPGS